MLIAWGSSHVPARSDRTGWSLIPPQQHFIHSRYTSGIYIETTVLSWSSLSSGSTVDAEVANFWGMH